VRPAYELRVTLRDPDGRVCARTRLCWAETPTAAAVLATLAARAAGARRRGLELVVQHPPYGLAPLLGLAGLDGPIRLDPAV
jgi:hypothetical protein